MPLLLRRSADRHPRLRLGGYPVTGGGWPSFYMEDMVGHAQCATIGADQHGDRRRLRALPYV